MANRQQAKWKPLLNGPGVWKKEIQEIVSGKKATERDRERIVEHLRAALERYDYAFLHGDVSAEIHKARMEVVKRRVDAMVLFINDAFNRVVRHRVLAHFKKLGA